MNARYDSGAPQNPTDLCKPRVRQSGKVRRGGSLHRVASVFVAHRSDRTYDGTDVGIPGCP